MNRAMLSCSGLTIRTSSGRVLLDGVTLDLAQGESVVLLGDSGSGKTLLGQALAGFIPGGCSIENPVGGVPRDVSELESRVITRIVVPQSPGHWLPPAESVGQLLRDALSNWDPARVQPVRWHAEAVDLLRSSGFEEPEHLLELLPDELSGGMNQRVAIAVAAALRPDLCFIDEPTAGLDPMARMTFLRALRSLRECFEVLVFASHDIPLAWGLASRAIVLRDGKVIFDGPLVAAVGCEDEYVNGLVRRGQ